MKRPRFSLRTLAIVVALICAYFGAWEWTKHAAMRMEFPTGVKATSPAPLVIRIDEKMFRARLGRCYYLWLIGPLVQLTSEYDAE